MRTRGYSVCFLACLILACSSKKDPQVATTPEDSGVSNTPADARAEDDALPLLDAEASDATVRPDAGEFADAAPINTVPMLLTSTSTVEVPIGGAAVFWVSAPDGTAPVTIRSLAASSSSPYFCHDDEPANSMETYVAVTCENALPMATIDNTLYPIDLQATSHGTPVAAVIIRAKSIPTPSVTTYPVSDSGKLLGLVAGPDGNMWFADTGGRIGRMTPAGVLDTFPGLPVTGGIIVGPDGNLWFSGGNVIGRITTAGEPTLFPIPTANANSVGLTAGLDGNIWFTERDGGRIGQLTPAGEFTEFTTSGHPAAIASSVDGNLWFSALGAGGGAEIASISGTGVPGINFVVGGPEETQFTLGPDHNLWFGDLVQNVRTITRGMIRSYPIPKTATGASSVATGADNAIWFKADADKVGRMYIDGTGSIWFPMMTSTQTVAVNRIAAGVDGNIWFTGNLGTTNIVGKIAQ